MTKYVYSDEDIGKRVIYIDRACKEHKGTIRGGTATAKMVDVKLDNHHATREHFYVPQDTVVIIPDELADIVDPEKGSADQDDDNNSQDEPTE